MNTYYIVYVCSTRYSNILYLYEIITTPLDLDHADDLKQFLKIHEDKLKEKNKITGDNPIISEVMVSWKRVYPR